MKRHLEVGYVARAHGLNGEVGVKTFDPASQTLLDVERVLLRLKDGSEREAAIEASRSTGKEILVSFEGVSGRGSAEALVGSTVLAFREDLGELEEGEYFQGDLVGMVAVDEAGTELGQVAEIWSSGPVPNLVIRGEGKPELMVPFVDEFVPSVDAQNRRLVVRPLRLTD